MEEWLQELVKIHYRNPIEYLYLISEILKQNQYEQMSNML